MSTRPKRSPGETRKLVEQLRADGLSYGRIASKLNVGKGVVAYHARRLGVEPDQRFKRRYDWTAVQAAIDGGASMRECMERFGFSRDAWGKAVKRMAIVPREWVTPIEDLLVAGPRRSRSHLKQRLIRVGLKDSRCERCGITDWQDQKLSLQLHHVNGDGRDNRLQNLQLLCPNCHSQTDTFAGRNKRRRAVRGVAGHEEGSGGPG